MRAPDGEEGVWIGKATWHDHAMDGFFGLFIITGLICVKIPTWRERWRSLSLQCMISRQRQRRTGWLWLELGDATGGGKKRRGAWPNQIVMQVKLTPPRPAFPRSWARLARCTVTFRALGGVGPTRGGGGGGSCALTGPHSRTVRLARWAPMASGERRAERC